MSEVMGMWAKSLLVAVSICSLGQGCGAVTLHIGADQIPLSATRYTSPSLAVMIGGTKYWGALFSDVAPSGALQVNVNGMKYWLGEYCAPGKYLPDGAFRCADCGLGHYCTGGRHRAACTGGIIGCPGTQASKDTAAPSFANRLLTAAEISANVPETDLSQWRQISCCNTQDSSYVSTLEHDLSMVNTVKGCANNKLGVGTYLFTDRPAGFCYGTDPIGGYSKSAFSSDMLIIDSAAAYKTIHATDVYYHFVDIDDPEFTNWDFRVPSGYYCNSDIRTNISGIGAVPRSLCVYELR